MEIVVHIKICLDNPERLKCIALVLLSKKSKSSGLQHFEGDFLHDTFAEAGAGLADL